MQILEHPDITCALRTGYPRREHKVWSTDIYCVSEDEYLQILIRRGAAKAMSLTYSGGDTG